MARKAKPAYQFPSAGQVWLFSNGEQRQVIATNGPFIEWKHLSGLTCGRFAPSGICDLRGWYEGKISAIQQVS